MERRGGIPLRYAGGIVPKSLEKLYFIGMIAPRGPQISIYGTQAKLAIRMIALHEAAADGFAGVAGYLGRLQEDEDRIDIVRAVWLKQLEDTERLLDAYVVLQLAKEHVAVWHSCRIRTEWAAPARFEELVRPAAEGGPGCALT